MENLRSKNGQLWGRCGADCEETLTVMSLVQGSGIWYELADALELIRNGDALKSDKRG